MEVQIIRIGNSKGIRLSKTLLERYRIRDSVDLVMKKGHIIIKPVSKPRKGWEKAFREMHEAGEDQAGLNESHGNKILEEWK